MKILRNLGLPKKNSDATATMNLRRMFKVWLSGWKQGLVTWHLKGVLPCLNNVQNNLSELLNNCLQATADSVLVWRAKAGTSRQNGRHGPGKMDEGQGHLGKIADTSPPWLVKARDVSVQWVAQPRHDRRRLRAFWWDVRHSRPAGAATSEGYRRIGDGTAAAKGSYGPGRWFDKGSLEKAVEDVKDARALEGGSPEDRICWNVP